MIRSDITSTLIHLTRDGLELNAEEVFDKILKEKVLLGSSKHIRGGSTCICFSETPISSIGQILAINDPNFRYGPFGFMFKKKTLFDLGARPVIYQPETDYKLLPDELKYRHVRFEVDTTDWTWEREWRLKKEKLELKPEDVTLIVNTRKKVEEIKKAILGGPDLLAMATSGYLSGKKLEWHFLALEDFGFI